jgi:hypothetical protein
MPTTTPRPRNQCPVKKLWMPRKKAVKAPEVDLAAMEEGFFVIFAMVSRMEVREGRMASPVEVVSQ